MGAHPANVRCTRRIERGTIRRGATGKPSVDEQPRTQGAEHGCRAADVIGVRMRQHEDVELTAASPNVWQHCGLTRVAAAPGASGVE